MSRISRRMIFWSILIGFCGAFLLSLWQFNLEFDQRIKERQAQIVSYGELFTPPLTQSLWTIDLTQLQLQAEGISRLADVDSVHLVFQEGEIHVPPESASTNSTQISEHGIYREFPLVYTDGDQVYDLGTLSISSDLDDTYSMIIKNQTTYFALSFVVVLMITISVSVLYNVYVTRRVLWLAERTRSITASDLREVIPEVSLPARRGGRDELDELAASISDLCATGHQALVDVEDSEERFALSMKSSHDGLFDWNLETDEVYYSPRWCQMLGFGPDELDGHLSTWKTLVDPLSRQKTLDLIDQYLAGEIPSFETEFRMRHKKGAWVHVLARGFAVFKDGKPVRVIGTHLDITARKAAEEALKRSQAELEKRVKERTKELERSQARYQHLVDGLTSHILFSSAGTGIHEVVTYASPSVQQVLGYAPEDIIGKPVAELTSPKTFGTSPGPYDEGFDYHKPYFREMFDANGNPRLMEILARPIRDGNGIIVGLEGIAHDVTERKRAEADLIKAQAEAQRANASKSAFLANMSHEIRTPMNGVIGMLDLLSTDTMPEDDRNAVETIRRSAYALLTIIDDILDISKIEAGKLSLAPEKIVVEDEVDGLMVLLDPIAQDKQVDLSISFDPKIPPHLIGDGTRLRQILTNLIGNAIKFSSTPEKRGRVRFRTSLDRIEAGKVWLLFEVEDNGIGIEASTLKRLFTPFEQADAGTTRTYGGTGLGLVISQNLARLMGGNIEVESEVGKGSTFSVCLPFTIAKDDAPLLQADLSGLEAIVLCDDEVRSARFTTYIEAAGAKVYATEDAFEAAVAAYPDGEGPNFCIITADEPANEEAEKLLHKLGHHKVSILRIEKTGTGKVTQETDTVFRVDAYTLARRRFLSAVATAAGRIPVDTGTTVAAHKKTPPVVIDRKQPKQASAEQSDTQTESQVILVAEDNEINQIVLDRQITTLGYAAHITNDGVEAFERWNSGEYAILLTDLHMPRMDGYDLAAKIRLAEQDTGRTPTKIIALTANAVKGEADRCLSAGMDGYLSKPVTLEQLQGELSRWINEIS